MQTSYDFLHRAQSAHAGSTSVLALFLRLLPDHGYVLAHTA